MSISVGRLVILAATFAAVGCGGGDASVAATPEPVIAPPVVSVRPAAPDGAEARQAAIERASAFASKKYAGQVLLDSPQTTWIIPSLGGAGEASGERGPGPGPDGSPPPVAFPSMNPPRAAKPAGVWQVMFRLAKPVHSEPDQPPLIVRVFHVTPDGQVSEQPGLRGSPRLLSPAPAGK